MAAGRAVVESRVSTTTRHAMQIKTYANKNIGRIARILAIAAVLLFPLAASAAQDKTLRAPARPPAPAAAPAKPRIDILREAALWPQVGGENRIKDFSSEVGGIRLDRFLIKPELHQASGLLGDESAVASAEYYFGDALQSVHQVTNATGAIVRTQFTDAWGNDLDVGLPKLPTGPGDRHGFQGRESDTESGLQHFRARSYDPMTGRFTSRDPVPYPNLYYFVGNDPVNKTDPSGRDITDDDWAKIHDLSSRLGSANSQHDAAEYARVWTEGVVFYKRLKHAQFFWETKDSQAVDRLASAWGATASTIPMHFGKEAALAKQAEATSQMGAQLEAKAYVLASSDPHG